MDPTTIAPWIALAISMIVLANHVFGWFTAGEKKALAEVAKVSAEIVKNAAALAELKRQMEVDDKLRTEAILIRFHGLEGRVQTIEGELKHVPSGKAAQQLEIAVERLSGQLSVLEERMKPIAAINARLQEWALERGK